MHSLLDRSVHLGYGCFGVICQSPELCTDKEYMLIWYNFQTCSIDGYRIIMPGSDIFEHHSYSLKSC